MHFSYLMPTKVYFGWQSLAAAPEYIAPWGQRVLLITGKYAMKKLGFTDQLLNGLAAKGLATALFDGVSAEPLASEVDLCVNQFAAWQPDVIVALGGGSVIDAARGVALGLTTGESVVPYLLGTKPVPAVSLPLVAIPTTAGTGSEANRAAILTDSASATKTSFRHDSLFAKVAIVDPALTASLPPQVTRDSGFDVLAHAVETYLSRSQANPLVEQHSLAAIALVRDFLPQALAGGEQQEARTRMSYASLLMGFNLANSTTCLPHRLQYPLGVSTHTSHGAGLAAVFRSWLNECYPYAGEKLERVASVLGGRPCQGVQAVLAAYDAFAASIQLQGGLASLGVERAAVPALAAQVRGDLSNDPAGMVPGIVEKIYNGAV